MSADVIRNPREALNAALERLRESKADPRMIAAIENLDLEPSAIETSPDHYDNLPFLFAATRGSFSVADLRESIDKAGGQPHPAALSQVLDESLAVAGLDAPQRYVLSDAARADALKIWRGRPELDASLHTAENDGDTQTQFLARILRDPEAIDLCKLDHAEMQACASAAAMAMRSTSTAAPLYHEARRRLDLEEIIRPLRILINKESPVGEGLGPDCFVGRERELRALYAHVGIRPSESIGEMTGRLVKSAFEAFAGAPKGALVLHGIGGMGKSALVAKFVLEHVRRDEHWLPFAYLDFDRSTLAGAEATALLVEIARQIGLQIDARRVGQEAANEMIEALRHLRAELREEMSKGATRSYGGYLPRIREIVDRFAEDRPFLLVLDTLERVQALGSEGLARVTDLLESLGLFDDDPRLRVVACSRADAPELRAAGTRPSPIELRALTANDSRDLARALLRHLPPNRRIPESLIEAIVGASKGYPLFIRVLTAHVERANLDSDEDLVRELQSTSGKAARVATVLYSRFADRIALPGGATTFKAALCLRTVTRERLHVVLRGVHPRLGEAESDAAFETLGNDPTFWVEKTPTSLRWRSDLRGLLIGCIRDESEEELQRVAGLVASSLVPDGDEVAADALYYALLAGEGVTKADEKFWRPGLSFREALVDAAQDFPVESAEAIYLELVASAARLDLDHLRILPASVGWRLAWDANPNLGNLGGEAWDATVDGLVDIAPEVDREDAKFRAERFALLVKAGHWREAEHALAGPIIGEPLGRNSVLHWLVRAVNDQSQTNLFALAEELVVNACGGVVLENAPGGRDVQSVSGDTQIAALVAARVLRMDDHFERLDQMVAALDGRGFESSSMLMYVLLAGSFGEAASDWAVDVLDDSKTLRAVSLRQALMLRDFCESAYPSLLSRLEHGFRQANAGLPTNVGTAGKSYTQGHVIDAVVTTLSTLRHSIADEDRRRAFFRSFFGQRNPEWVEVLSYALNRAVHHRATPIADLWSTAEELRDQGTLDANTLFDLSFRSEAYSVPELTDTLRILDEAGALPTYLTALRPRLERPASFLSSSISSLRSVFGASDEKAPEAIADVLWLIERFQIWVRMKENSAAPKP